MDRLLRALERATGRTLNPGPREKLEEWGILQPEWEKRDYVKPLPHVAPTPIPQKVPQQAIPIPGPTRKEPSRKEFQRQFVISQLLRNLPDQDG